ncbi:MAG: 4Fe-4S binding protein [Halobacteriota archaeon]|nr:4Fe-4S binding protein [Halobacteriota archaeon]
MAKVKRQMIEIDEEECDGCGNCVISCPEGALEIIDGKAKVVRESFCDGLGACIGECPQGALSVREAEVEEYDESGVIGHIKENSPDMLQKHLDHLKAHADELPERVLTEANIVTSCPGSRAMKWDAREGTTEGNVRASSELRQWPVQLHLVSPEASYFKDADLIIVADCVPFAYANFHQDFLKGKAIIIGCPKLDDADFYLEKITQLLKSSDVKSIEVINMEVPCCFGLMRLVSEAIKRSGKDIPLKQRVIGIKGDIIK